MRAELNRRARRILAGPGVKKDFPGVSLEREIRVEGYLLALTNGGTMMVEDMRTRVVVYVNYPSVSADADGEDHEVTAALNAIRQHMVLEDLADV